MSDTADTLWHSIVTAYALPGVAPLCRRLQEEAGVDVPLLLAAAFAAGPMDMPLSVAEAEVLCAVSTPWRKAAVLPVRALRMALRQGVAGTPDTARDAFREKVKALELEAERTEIALLAVCMDARVPEAPADALQGLRHLCGDAPVCDAELRMLVAAFGR